MLKSKGSNGFQDQDDIAMIPLTTMQDNFTGATTAYSQLVVEAGSAKHDRRQARSVATLDADHGITDRRAAEFKVLNQTSLLSATSSNTHTFTVLLGAVAAISLLVGGIGVMNIMLVTVTERTREIGIRKAIGARKPDILGQFLVEAVLLSLLGGLLGVAGGLVGSQFKIDRHQAGDRALLGRPRLRRRVPRRAVLRHLPGQPGRVPASHRRPALRVRSTHDRPRARGPTSRHPAAGRGGPARRPPPAASASGAQAVRALGRRRVHPLRRGGGVLRRRARREAPRTGGEQRLGGLRRTRSAGSGTVAAGGGPRARSARSTARPSP